MTAADQREGDLYEQKLTGQLKTTWDSSSALRRWQLFDSGSNLNYIICILSDVGVPKLISVLSRIRISGVRASAFPIRGIQDLRRVAG